MTTNVQTVSRSISTTAYTGEISPFYKDHMVSVTFYKDNEPVVPTSGNIYVEASDDGINYGTLATGAIDATTPNYTRPTASGRVKRVKAVPHDIQGADTYILTVTSWK